MKQRRVFLNINDLDNNIDNVLVYKLTKIIKYIDLYKKLPTIFTYLGKTRIYYKKSEIEFLFLYEGKKILIDDWTKYVLNNEKIIINVKRKPTYYYLTDVTNHIILKSRNIKNIYKHYQENNYNFPVFVKREDKLLDVLDNPDTYLNSCINRLISKYNY